ncbi:sulfotransferase [Nocardioides sp. URHA0020]|uniref:sulfotransferase n=1 Tax=Nocardioides sp. URHA0020 TaxID=1380392 RepID=UPI000AE42BC2|nr:sulfotransferase [Nocardioides sp. URHA0020]
MFSRLRAKPAEPVGPSLEYLFVMTYGRSGSTLTQGILNSIPGYLIRGENWQAMRHLYEFDRSATNQRKAMRRRQRQNDQPVGGSTPAYPFYGLDNYPRQKALRLIRRLVLETLIRPEEDTRVAGFKEIRWVGEDLPEFVAWMREVFPGARFVVNTRDLVHVSQSKWWADNPNALAILREREAQMLEIAAGLGADAFRIHYDDFVDDVEALAPLFEWLGEPFDRDRVREVLVVRHSY